MHWFEEHERCGADYAVLLQPTSPLRTAEDISAAVALARKKQGDSVVSVCAVHHHLYWTRRVTADGRLDDLIPRRQTYARRQDLPSAYILSGAMHAVRRAVLLGRRIFCTDQTYAYVMPPERSLDVDTEWDLYLADLILKDQASREIH